jgi:catechol 2,3-dioxygenase-like lactoylglutathione lyase family enzyme
VGSLPACQKYQEKENVTYRITPELDVENIDRSLKLYVDVLGFKVLYSRPEEKFAYLELDGIHLMLEEAAGPGRRFRTAPLEHPYGRGMNLQIEVADAKALHDRAQQAGINFVIPLEERWYRKDKIENGQIQFMMPDCDGYLLRFFSNLGERPAQE